MPTTYSYDDGTGETTEDRAELTEVNLLGVRDCDGNKLEAVVNRGTDSTTGDSHTVLVEREGNTLTVRACSCPAYEYHCDAHELCVHGAAVQHGHIDELTDA